MKCRFCSELVDRVFVDLGHQPPSNAYLNDGQLENPEVTYPLRVFVCEHCWLVQLPAHGTASELFTDEYAYFSSVSSSWVKHAERYVAEMVCRLELGADSLVMEIASNDGYLLQFVRQAGIACIGIEPTASTAAAARARGVETVEEFFGQDFAERFVRERVRQVDLLVANNVLAHVPDLNDFVAGVAAILKPAGVVTFEFPHLMRLVEGMQFDTIYHEHYSYLSFYTVCRLLDRHGLRVFDVCELSTHGGSLRVFATPAAAAEHPATEAVAELLKREQDAGMRSTAWYEGFQQRVELIKHEFLRFLLERKRKGEAVVGYGAAAKGNTLLNFAGVGPDLLPVVYDAAGSKQGKLLPGSHIPIQPPECLANSDPDVVIVLPWNIADEIVGEVRDRLNSSAEFVVAVPRLQTLE